MKSSRIIWSLLLVVPLCGVAASPLGLELCRRAFAFGVETILRQSVTLAPPNRYFVGAGAYHVDFWCTPTVLWLGAALLLFTSRSDARAYSRGLAWIFPLGALAMISNVVLSIALHQRGISWTWAHYPGLSLVYAAIFLLCLHRKRTSSKSNLGTLGQEVER